MNKGVTTLIGFLLFVLGVLALVLSIVGVQLVFLQWIDNWGGLVGFVIRLLMIIFGLVLVIVTRSDDYQNKIDSMSKLDEKQDVF